MRGINDRFIEDLKTGCLKGFLEAVKTNDKLWLGIRKNYINIYYCGGNAVRIRQTGSTYESFFDIKYCDNKPEVGMRSTLETINYRNCEQVLSALPLMLAEMDSWFAVHPKPERTFQHILLQHNPCILDIEYAGWTKDRKGFRLDMLAYVDESVVIVENKFGNSVIGGKAGLTKHYRDIATILGDNDLRNDLFQSARNIAENKRALGLPTASIDKNQTEILFLLTDYIEKGKALANEFSQMDHSVPAKILLMNSTETIMDLSKAKTI